MKAGIETICEDDINAVMSAQELPCWNLLTRSKQSYPNIDKRVIACWYVGFAFRYIFLLPVRVLLLASGLLWLGVGSLLLTRVDSELDALCSSCCSVV